MTDTSASMSPTTSPASAQSDADRLARIRAAFHPNLLRDLGYRLVDRLSQHLESAQASEGRVLNWGEPLDYIAQAGRALDTGSLPIVDSSQTVVAERFDTLVNEMLSHGHNLHDPHYIGHQVPAPVPIAGWFDAVGSVTNQVMAIYEMGPWATAVERALVQRLGESIGWPTDSFSGFVTHGGSLANLTGLLTARNVVLGDAWETGIGHRDAVLVTHQDAHYSVARAAGVLGIGTRNVIRAGLNSKRQMDPQKLDELLTSLRTQNRTVVAVSACSCATPIGAFDPLEDIAAVCRRHDVWLHVDAAHGGAACLSNKYRHLMRGVDQVDSLVWDAHKMMFVPALCAFVFYRNKAHRFEAFRQDAPYLFDPSAPGLAEFDSGMMTPECTKRAAAYGLWGTWAMFGRGLFEDLVDATFDLGKVFYEMLSETSDFTPLHEPQCNIVAFRYVPTELQGKPEAKIAQFMLDLRRELIHSGEFYIVQTKLDGQQALRVTIINPLTTRDHLAELFTAIRRTGQRLLATQ